MSDKKPAPKPNAQASQAAAATDLTRPRRSTLSKGILIGGSLIAGMLVLTVAITQFAGISILNPRPSLSEVSTLVGSDVKGESLVDAPYASLSGVSFDSKGNAFVSDSSHHQIRRITPDGTDTVFAGTGDIGFKDGDLNKAQFTSPAGLVVDANDNIYVVDTGNHRIRMITPDGKVKTLAGGGATEWGIGAYADGKGDAARFNAPYAIALSQAGDLYVSDTENNRVRKVTLEGEVTTIAGVGVEGAADGPGNQAQFNSPRGIVVDTLGNIFVADALNNRIRKINTKGVVSTFAGNGASGREDGTGRDALFNVPSGLTIDKENALYVADTFNNTIRKITLAGRVYTLAGTGKSGFLDGRVDRAMFSGPTAVAFDPVGRLYVTDLANNRIRVIE